MKYNVMAEQASGTPEKSALKVKVYEEDTEPIGTDGIADGAVTSAKIADGAVTQDKIASGVIPEPYTLPTASADTLGGVKVGDGLSIADGVLSASGGGEGGMAEPITFRYEQPGSSNIVCSKTYSELSGLDNTIYPIILESVTSNLPAFRLLNVVFISDSVQDDSESDYSGYVFRFMHNGTEKCFVVDSNNHVDLVTPV